MQTNLTSVQLEKIQAQGNILKSLYDALTLLENIGILDFLKTRSTVHILPDGDNRDAQATLAAWKAGYNECVNDLILFRERYLNNLKPEDAPLRDYGALKRAVSEGHLTQDEADAIQSRQLSKLESTYRNTGRASTPGSTKSE